MIQVENLTRRYGEFTAVDDVSFQIGRGEVVGFLGPNGAGKSTTMRILCGCIGATAGRVRINGVDVLDSPRTVKRGIGYLPEVPPLYGTMPVEEYVAFAASLKGVANPAHAAAEAIEQVGLGDVRHRVIDHLSKGYRQRVGLAQALAHKPDLLVLDEPTSGLDPAQRREIRDLLLSLAGGERTVILSTHVLAEVEAVCERVMIINRGRLVASDRIADLTARAAEVRLQVARPSAALAKALGEIPGVNGVTADPDGVYRVGAPPDLRPRIAEVAVSHGLLSLGGAQGLEDVYLQLTGATTALEPSA